MPILLEFGNLVDSSIQLLGKETKQALIVHQSKDQELQFVKKRLEPIARFSDHLLDILTESYGNQLVVVSKLKPDPTQEDAIAPDETLLESEQAKLELLEKLVIYAFVLTVEQTDDFLRFYCR